MRKAEQHAMNLRHAAGGALYLLYLAVSPYISLYLPAPRCGARRPISLSPCISLYLPHLPAPRCGARRLYLPISPCISLYLPTSPCATLRACAIVALNPIPNA